VVLVVTFAVGITSAGITAASSVLDRRRTYGLLHLARPPLLSRQGCCAGDRRWLAGGDSSSDARGLIVPGRPVVILKADPGEARALREHNSHITPGYHMNKRHWITLEGGTGVDKKLVRELVTDSYLLVVAHLPKAEQPVDPHTYGTSTRAAR
jgi:hypothetical protein